MVKLGDLYKYNNNIYEIINIGQLNNDNTSIALRPLFPNGKFIVSSISHELSVEEELESANFERIHRDNKSYEGQIINSIPGKTLLVVVATTNKLYCSHMLMSNKVEDDMIELNINMMNFQKQEELTKSESEEQDLHRDITNVLVVLYDLLSIKNIIIAQFILMIITIIIQLIVFKLIGV